VLDSYNNPQEHRFSKITKLKIYFIIKGRKNVNIYYVNMY